MSKVSGWPSSMTAQPRTPTLLPLLQTCYASHVQWKVIKHRSNIHLAYIQINSAWGSTNAANVRVTIYSTTADTTRSQTV